MPSTSEQILKRRGRPPYTPEQKAAAIAKSRAKQAEKARKLAEIREKERDREKERLVRARARERERLKEEARKRREATKRQKASETYDPGKSDVPADPVKFQERRLRFKKVEGTPLSQRELDELRGKSVVFTHANQVLALSPGQIAHIRGKVASIIDMHLPTAANVIAGHAEWTPVQARIFVAMLDKVVPNLSANHSIHDHRVQGIAQMSREDLERIARGLDDIQTITAEPISATTHEPPSPHE